MGLFVQRPEEPSEWAGLPSEPARPRTKAELLPVDDRPAASPTGLLGLADDSTTSIAIPLGDSTDAAEATEHGGAGDTAPPPRGHDAAG